MSSAVAANSALAYAVLKRADCLHFLGSVGSSS